MSKNLEQRVDVLEQTVNGIVNGAPAKTRAPKRAREEPGCDELTKDPNDDTDPDIAAVLDDSDDELDGDDE